ncbi:MAG: hypothetical protein L0211_20990 [Planctomycetaceae bacterium]|nr:hypothetical protein [Planctomycetaceae bacterium]
MERYHLAKLVQFAGTLRTRKALQKVVYLLQSAGCPLEADYSLHYFGPYSADVARLTDEMTQLELLKEEPVANPAGQQFNYELTPRTQVQIRSFEATPEGKAAAAVFSPFEDLARELVRVEPRELELAATVAYFKRCQHNWDEAVAKACDFKRVNQDSPQMQRAIALAERVVPSET